MQLSLSPGFRQKKVGQNVKSSKELTKTQVSDNKDLVRYETGVTTVEAGRFGQSGYVIRDVEENRIAITIDGLHQTQTLFFIFRYLVNITMLQSARLDALRFDPGRH